MTTNLIRVALIDDDQDDYLLIKDLLNSISNTKYQVDWFSNSAAGLEALKQHTYDVYLVDYRIDNKTGLDLLDEIQIQEIKRSIILLTAQGDHKLDVEAMNKGAADYLNKAELTSENLERSIRYCLKRAMDQEKIKDSEKLRIEKEAADSANRAKTLFLANMSHEIRTPLGVIMGFTDLAMEPNISPDQRNIFLTTIKKNSIHLLDLINDILDLSKVECGKFQVSLDFFNWRDLVYDLVNTMTPQARTSSLNVNFKDDQNIPQRLKSDAHRVRQILINLIGNAIKFTEKGSVTVHCHIEDIAGSSNFVIDVTDTGIGLTEQERFKLFKPFEQANASLSRRFGGTGLGLDLSRKLAQALGGDLSLLSSEKGIGSIFRLSLPAEFEKESKRKTYENNLYMEW